MPKPDPVFQGPDNQDELTNAAMHTIPFEFASTDQAREAAGPDEGATRAEYYSASLLDHASRHPEYSATLAVDDRYRCQSMPL